MQDNIKIWRTKSWTLKSHVDSFRIMAVGIDEDHVALQQRLHSLGDSIKRIAGRDFGKNIHNDPQLDSLNQKFISLSIIGKFLSERFEYRLVLIDSCLNEENDLESKIYDAEHKKARRP